MVVDLPLSGTFGITKGRFFGKRCFSAEVPAHMLILVKRNRSVAEAH